MCYDRRFVLKSLSLCIKGPIPLHYKVLSLSLLGMIPFSVGRHPFCSAFVLGLQKENLMKLNKMCIVCLFFVSLSPIFISFTITTMKRTILLLLTALSLTAQAQIGQFFPSDRFSSSLVSDICQDRLGSLWVATDYGLNKFDGYRFAYYLHQEGDDNSMRVNGVVSLLCDKEGRLWVGTNHGLDRYDEATDAFVHYNLPGEAGSMYARVSSIIQRKDGTILVGTAGYGMYTINKEGNLQSCNIFSPEMFFSRLLEDSRGRLWKSGFDETIVMHDGKKMQTFHSLVGNPQAIVEHGDELLVVCLHGLMSYHNGQMMVSDIDISEATKKDAVLTSASVAADGSLYIGTRGQGVYMLKVGSRRLEHVDIDAAGLDANTTKVNCIMTDRTGNLWLGCQRKGLLMVPLKPAGFSNWSFQSQGINLGSAISAVCEGDDGMVWCTVQGVGIYGFNRKGHVVAQPAAPDAVEFMYRDKQNRYWVGTDNAFYAYDPLTGRFQMKVTFECDRFNDMTSDDEGRLYLSSFSKGFCIYDPATGSLRNHNFSERDSLKGYLCNNWIMSMESDQQGLIWMATSSGISCYDPQTDNFRSQGWNSQLDGVVCFDVTELHNGSLADGRQLDGCIAIGTELGLFLYDRQTKRVEHFPGSEQLDNKTVCYIVQSNNGDVWCSTTQGIWQYQQSNHTFLGHVSGNGLAQKEFLYGIGMHTDDDMVIFGHNDGFTAFLPRKIVDDRTTPDSLHLTALLVSGQGVNTRTVLNDVKITDVPVSESDHFMLSYLDHTITLCFSQMNFYNPSNVFLEYRVNGGDWIRNSAGANDFTLSHLQPGTYRIEVRAQQGNDYTPVKVVTVTVKAPWYRTTLAYCLYFAAFIALVIFVLFNYRRRAHQQLYEEKMKFLINATHDIRSPLTLIMSPLANLKRHIGAEQPEAQRDIDTIDHNAKRILNLVNQILDVRKIDKQQMQLHCQQTDLVSFTQGICKMFEYSAKERGIDFEFHHDSKKLDIWIDRNQFDKVITNLLSNAFKYNFNGGAVEVNLIHDDTHATLQVIDNGVGLDSDNLKHIFERFYQGGNSRKLHVAGTGIGLNLCKMIVDMHHGTIEARNRKDQQGSVFEVKMLLGNSHLQPSEIEESPAPSTPTVKVSSSSKHRVLIVDDDVEIGRYISTELGRYYKFGICNNGKDGLKELLLHAQDGSGYDVVVSDVMMPEMDGFTMLRMIKTNTNVAHVPVVMLTSKADVANRLEGLERGADAFLAKPFDMEELHMVIENLIQGRQRLKGKYSGAQKQIDKVVQPEVKGNDELLMERIMKAVNKHISNSDFNVDMLTQEVGISRAQLHRKMKEMTGISTSEFIRNIRLEQAARLLKEQKINITQVAYTVGFSNLAHFSTIFRKHFGVAPSEYGEMEDGDK